MVMLMENVFCHIKELATVEIIQSWFIVLHALMNHVYICVMSIVVECTSLVVFVDWFIELVSLNVLPPFNSHIILFKRIDST